MSVWCVRLQISLLRSNIIAALQILQKKYARCVSPKYNKKIYLFDNRALDKYGIS